MTELSAISLSEVFGVFPAEGVGGRVGETCARNESMTSIGAKLLYVTGARPDDCSTSSNCIGLSAGIISSESVGALDGGSIVGFLFFDGGRPLRFGAVDCGPGVEVSGGSE